MGINGILGTGRLLRGDSELSGLSTREARFIVSICDGIRSSKNVNCSEIRLGRFQSAEITRVK
jgi:hypothetical protein